MASDKHVISLRIVHEVPGRIRCKCDGLSDAPEIAQRIDEFAAQLTGIESVTIRAANESVILRYSLEETSAPAFRREIGRHARLVRLSAPDPTEDMPLGEEMIHRVRRFWTRADHHIAGATKGSLDLRSSLPWLFILIGFRQVAVSPDLPAIPWYTAFYHSLQTVFLYRDEKRKAQDEDVELFAGPDILEGDD